jgi:hypothetical protein
MGSVRMLLLISIVVYPIWWNLIQINAGMKEERKLEPFGLHKILDKKQ